MKFPYFLNPNPNMNGPPRPLNFHQIPISPVAKVHIPLNSPKAASSLASDDEESPRLYNMSWLTQIGHHFRNLTKTQKIIYATFLIIMIIGGIFLGLFMAGVLLPRSNASGALAKSSDNAANAGNAAISISSRPLSCVTDTQDNIYVADINNQAIRVIDKNGIVSTLFSGNNSKGSLLAPAGLAIDVTNGILYVADVT